MFVVMTNESVSRWVNFFSFSVSLNSPFELLSSINTPVKGHVKDKTASVRVNCSNVRAKQNSLNVSWSNGWAGSSKNGSQDWFRKQ